MSGPIIPVWFAFLILIGFGIPIAASFAAIIIGIVVKNWIWAVGGIMGGFFYWLLVFRRFF